MSFIYLASPYSHPNPGVMMERYLRVRTATAFLLRNRVWTYSPIVHCHELALAHQLPTGAEYWEEYNHAMLGRARELFVLQLPGWEESKGIKGEMDFAKRKKIPICMMKHVEADEYSFLDEDGFEFGVDDI